MDELAAAIGTSIRDDVDCDGLATILPIRHHSPSCAWHVRRVIVRLRPDVVLIEGPSDANHLLPMLIDPKTVPPVAILSHTLQGKAGSKEVQEPTQASLFYPFCVYSPEYVAIHSAHPMGASAAFIDVPSWWIADFSKQTPRVNAYADHQLRHQEFIARLCQRASARDFDELWDHLFESRDPDEPSEAFFTAIATFCQAVRRNADSERIASDGTLTREMFMAGHIRDALSEGKRVVAVIGGFHRQGILTYLSSKQKLPKGPAKPKTHATYLTIYGYPQLDAWGGYEAGMPAPKFQHLRWEQLTASDSHQAPSPVAARRSAVAYIAPLAADLRRRGFQISTSDLIAASSLLEGIGPLRGHRQWTLADVHDAIIGSWARGSMEDAGASLQKVLNDVLVGEESGRVCNDSGRPPLVNDFYQQLIQLKLYRRETELAEKRHRTVQLDLYRRSSHRRRSAFLHQLREIGCGFAILEAGPDFVQCRDLDRVREQWSLHWTPRVELALVEASAAGATVAEAAENMLLKRAASSSLHSSDAVAILTSALVMGFDHLAEELVALARKAIIDEGVFSLAAAATEKLLHLQRYRQILGAARFPAIAELGSLGLRRALWLIDTLPGLPTSVSEAPGSADDPLEAALQSLILLRHVVISGAGESVDRAEFFDALQKIRGRLGRHPLLEGAVLGVLRQAGQLDENAVTSSLHASVNNTQTARETSLGDYLRGLFTASRHAITAETGLFDCVDDVVALMDENEFLRALPRLRLAFSVFSPREVKRLVNLFESRRARGAAKENVATVNEAVAIGERVDEEVRKVLALLEDSSPSYLDATAGGGTRTA